MLFDMISELDRYLLPRVTVKQTLLKIYHKAVLCFLIDK